MNFSFCTNFSVHISEHYSFVVVLVQGSRVSEKVFTYFQILLVVVKTLPMENVVAQVSLQIIIFIRRPEKNKLVS